MTQLDEETIGGHGVASIDMKLEVVVIPVSDVDRSKAFYEGLGWRHDADLGFDNGFAWSNSHLAAWYLHPVRNQSDSGRPRVVAKPAPGRLRHRRSP